MPLFIAQTDIDINCREQNDYWHYPKIEAMIQNVRKVITVNQLDKTCWVVNYKAMYK